MTVDGRLMPVMNKPLHTRERAAHLGEGAGGSPEHRDFLEFETGFNVL
jgi:hypothetical protein